MAGTCVAIVGSGREENRNNSYPHAAGLAQPSGIVVVQEYKAVFLADSESSAIRRLHLDNGRVSAVCGGDKNPAVRSMTNTFHLFSYVIFMYIHVNEIRVSLNLVAVLMTLY